jgi:hypothetical protein
MKTTPAQVLQTLHNRQGPARMLEARINALMNNQGRLPPYGRKLLDQKPRPADELRLYFGTNKDVWSHALLRNTYAPPALVLPPGTCVSQFSWPVNGWPVLAIQIGTYEVNEIPIFATVLLKGGASIVRVLYGKNPDLAIFRPVYVGIAA